VGYKVNNLKTLCSPCRCNFQHAFHALLPLHFREIDFVVVMVVEDVRQLTAPAQNSN
jgi:hypothetical protein